MSIRVKKLLFSYRHFNLKIEELNFENSEITSIVGPNGAGKTTLLKCLAMINYVDRDSIFINGKDIKGLKSGERAKIIGYVPQEHVPIFNFSVLDFVLTGRTPHLNIFSSPSKKDMEKAMETLKFVGIENYANRNLLQLSSGVRRLVLLARVIAQEPEIFLMDEPTSFLDPKHEIEIMELVKKLSREKKKTIILTIHNLDLAVKYSDNIVFMKDGEVYGKGRVLDILNEDILKKIYEINMKIIEIDGMKIIVK
ncbi:MAG: ABC transporter ATP-binding protein [Candidatus Aminicenantia bacterium]